MDNSVYSVTPPSLFLNENGPSIFCMGWDEDDIKRISSVFDKLFSQNSITYYYDVKNINDTTLPWARNVASTVDFIIVNADTANDLELFIACQTEIQGGEDAPPVFYVSEKQTNRPLNKLMVSYRKKLFNDIDSIEQLIMSYL